MDNKGQSIVIFIILMPILIFILAMVFELGNLMVKKQKYEHEIKSIIEYGLNNLEKNDLPDKMHVLLDKNLEGKKEININKEKIKINVKHKEKSTFSFMLDNEFDITYTGYIENKQIKIIKG